MALKGSGIIRRCDFVGVGIVLLEEVCHYGGVLCSCIYAQATPSVSDYFLLPVQGVELSATSPIPCMPACCFVPVMVIMN